MVVCLVVRQSHSVQVEYQRLLLVAEKLGLLLSNEISKKGQFTSVTLGKEGTEVYHVCWGGGGTVEGDGSCCS